MQWLGQTAVVSISRVLKHRAVLCAVNVLPAGLAGEELFPCQALELVLGRGRGAGVHASRAHSIAIPTTLLPGIAMVVVCVRYSRDRVR